VTRCSGALTAPTGWTARTSRVRSWLPREFECPLDWSALRWTRRLQRAAASRGRSGQRSVASFAIRRKSTPIGIGIRGLRQCKAGSTASTKAVERRYCPPSLLRLLRPRAAAQTPKGEEAVKLPRDDEGPPGRALVAVRPLPCHAATFPSRACLNGRETTRPGRRGEQERHAGREAWEGCRCPFPTSSSPAPNPAGGFAWPKFKPRVGRSVVQERSGGGGSANARSLGRSTE